ncbi:MAG: class I SAM-dependent methyltransferase [Rhodopila sp.]|nr:class I SAM-dependent methyltransferase [Rhodopila sp.]
MIGGVRFITPKGDLSQTRTTPEQVTILKNPYYLHQYARLRDRVAYHNVFEVGIYKGGTAIALALMFPDIRIVSIDIDPVDEGVMEAVRAFDLSDRVHLHYGASQTDRERIEAIISEEFGNERIELVTDDASHQYASSRRTFEILLPFLADESLYVLEDWAWAHWGGKFETRELRPEPALTNLLFEWVMIAGTRNDVIREVTIEGAMATAYKNSRTRFENVAIEDLYLRRGKTLEPI